MFQDTITLFNYHKATGLWFPSVLENVDLGVNTASISTKNGKNGNDTVNLIIHCSGDKKVTVINGAKKSYIGEKAYAGCKNPSSFITFKPESDFFYCGVWRQSEQIREEDYESGFYHAMNDEYDGVYIISSAAFYGLIPHFEIGGR